MRNQLMGAGLETAASAKAEGKSLTLEQEKATTKIQAMQRGKQARAEVNALWDASNAQSVQVGSNAVNDATMENTTEEGDNNTWEAQRHAATK
eukprot:scaffold241528_cov55-Prasinocladus_malaysianus.AAC.1